MTSTIFDRGVPSINYPLTFRVLRYAIALSWILVLNGEHVTGSFPLPNPIESPHIKNQSLVSCLSKYDPTIIIKAHPSNVSCQDPVFLTGSFGTPQEDVLSLACYGKAYLNKELLNYDNIANACVDVKELKCPLLKGKPLKFHFKIRMPCVISKGYYELTGYCMNQNGNMVGCLKWQFLWE
ncbi:uncharacterized protein LOC116294091 [Actinia tenebrosa]|uniref:Uncharacterized protein LOC116294091 n=1 Tax=Actinia tenebrosa TaxID=6105 RepID=A0A6P8HPC3_ACTTE|nr:uncharacterized protein LOC116294091 [Actinia tenebrosa]